MIYLALFIISIPITIMLLFVIFAFTFSGSLIGVGITMILQLYLSFFLYYKVTILRLRFFVVAFGLPMFIGFTFWSFLVFKDSKLHSIGLFVFGIFYSFFIPLLGKMIAKKYYIKPMTRNS